jgi:hypothetical protein
MQRVHRPRAKRHHHRTGGTESIGSDNSASSHDGAKSGDKSGAAAGAPAVKGKAGGMVAQSAAKSAAGILLSLSSSFHAP